MSEFAVRINNVSKTYRLYSSPIERLKSLFFKSTDNYLEVNALKDISFEIPRGKTFGIVGRNGSGKSTILSIISSIVKPTSGDVVVNGQVTALLELGSGFNPEFSGLDNVYLYASILGLSDTEIDDKLDDILEFAEIGDFIHHPLKTYSSGMMLRLAFSVAIFVNPEILIIDEALSVGDALFQHKCILKIRELIESESTVIF
ncbi:UNVERIFIED_CONTAM: hypothetical protein GTU68_000803, partial [Idotea baltica]|nr:hypothetical protein [Idotea baltica]